MLVTVLTVYETISTCPGALIQERSRLALTRNVDPAYGGIVGTRTLSSLGLSHRTGETASLQLLLEERRTPSESVVNRAELYVTLHTSHEATVPETGTNGAVGGKSSTEGPSRIDENATGLTKPVAPHWASTV